MPKYFVNKTCWYNQVYLTQGEVVDLPEVPKHMLNKLELITGETKADKLAKLSVKKPVAEKRKASQAINVKKARLKDLTRLAEPSPEDVEEIKKLKSELKELQE